MKRIIFLCLALSMLLSCLIIPTLADKAYLIDEEGILTQSEFYEIEAKLLSMSDEYDMDFVIVTSPDFDGMYAQDFADDFYDYSGYSSDGIIFVLSDTLGEVFISTSGKAMRYISDSDIDDIFDVILDDLSYGYYVSAFKKYLSECENLCDVDFASTTTSEPFLSGKQIGICAVIGIIIGFIGVSSMKSGMKTVRSKQNARDYLVSDSLVLSEKYDVFLYRNVSRTRRQSSSSGGNRIGSSGRSHGGSGRSFR